MRRLMSNKVVETRSLIGRTSMGRWGGERARRSGEAS